MFKTFQHNSGQAMMAQYVVTFFVVIGVFIVMSTFVQRALQGRIHDARNYMINQTSEAYGNQIAYEYEPYYGNVQTNLATDQSDQSRLLGDGTTGIFRKVVDRQVTANTVSEQAPPKDAQ